MTIQAGVVPQAYLLTLFRVLAIMVPLTFYGRAIVPMKVTVAMALIMTLALAPVLPESWRQQALAIHTMPEMLLVVLGEILLGAAVALVLKVFISVTLIAGQIMGMSCSLAVANAIDPVSGTDNLILAEVLQGVFIIIILLSNFHLAVLKMLADSFTVIPAGMHWLTQDLISGMVALGSIMFEWGVKLGAPVMAGILIVDTALGLISRIAPDFNILFLSFPIRLTGGLVLMGISMKMESGLFGHVVELMTRACSGVLGG